MIIKRKHKRNYITHISMYYCQVTAFYAMNKAFLSVEIDCFSEFIEEEWKMGVGNILNVKDEKYQSRKEYFFWLKLKIINMKFKMLVYSNNNMTLFMFSLNSSLLLLQINLSKIF